MSFPEQRWQDSIDKSFSWKLAKLLNGKILMDANGNDKECIQIIANVLKVVDLFPWSLHHINAACRCRKSSMRLP